MESKNNKKIIELLNEERIKHFSCKIDVNNESDFLLYDFSKTHISNEEVENYRQKLIKLNLKNKIKDMWTGKSINYTEKRPVLHYLLRDKFILNALKNFIDDYKKLILNKDIICKNNLPNNKLSEIKTMEEMISKYMNLCINQYKSVNNDDNLIAERKDIFKELVKMYDFCINFSKMKGIFNSNFKYIVSIGIGGSDLGPRMICKALEEYSQGYEVYFISNVDSSDALSVLKKIKIAQTLFIIVSKTFTTLETIENFKLIKTLGLERITAELKNNCNNDINLQDLEKEFVDKHFIAVSSNIKEIKKYGISKVFKMWDFVGGRYSLWSTVGISIALYIGFDNFLKLLSGAAKADQNFYEQQENSIAVMSAIIDLYYADNEYNNKCIVPYDSYLSLLYKYMQQAEMESNGKKGSKQMIIWGGTGTDVQHSFFQLLHQGEQNILTEFLIGIKSINEKKNSKVVEHQDLLISNCLAQSRSLMLGRFNDDEHKNILGNKPSVTILYSQLVPECLGAIISIYEHKIFTQGIYYNINSYDQYGVSLGKEIAIDIAKGLKNDQIKFDDSTNFLIENIKKTKNH